MGFWHNVWLNPLMGWAVIIFGKAFFSTVRRDRASVRPMPR